MNEKLSYRDFQSISIYLDGQMGAREQARFEERLHTEMDLQAALEELRLNRELLRRQPGLRAPRNFTLTPAMIGKQRPARAYPFLGLATAIAGLFLALLLVGDLFAQRAASTTLPVQLAASMQRQAEQPESAAEAPVAAPKAFAPTSTAALEAAPMAAMQAPAETPVENPQGTPAPSAKMVAPPAPATGAADSLPAETAAQTFSLEVDTSEAGQAYPEVIDQSGQIFGTPRNLWRGIEIFMALVAMTCGAAWLILRRRND